MRHIKLKSGFTLLELTIVLVIVGLMAGLGVQMASSYQGMHCYDDTAARMDQIRSAIQQFVAQNQRYPKPAYPNLGSGDPQFGMEATTASAPTDLAYATEVPTGMVSAAGGTVLIGELPHSALGLAVSNASDCWGNKYTYAVTNAHTSANTSNGFSSIAAAAIQLNTGSSAAPQVLSNTISYVVVSHGQDEFGATPLSFSNMTVRNCNGTTASKPDRENCDVASGGNAIFHDGIMNLADGAVDYFDDLLVYEQRQIDTNLFCWGRDSSGFGLLGNGNLSPHLQATPNRANTGTRFARFTNELYLNQNGGNAFCSLNIDGQLFCWGSNATRRVGDGTAINRAIPTAVGGTTRFKKLYRSLLNWYAIDTADRAYCWGSTNGSCPTTNSSQLLQFNGAITFQSIAMTDSQHAGCGLGTDGQAYCWGGGGEFTPSKGRGPTNVGNSTPVPVNGGRRFVKLVGTGTTPNFCGLTRTDDPSGPGRLYCWGSNSQGQLGVGDQLPRDVPTLVPGSYANIFNGRDAEPGFFAIGDAADANPGRLYSLGGSNGNGSLGIGGVAGVDHGTDMTSPTFFTVTNITSANPAVVTTSAPHGFVNGDSVNISRDIITYPQLTDIGYDPISGFGAFTGNTYVVNNATSTSFEIYHPGPGWPGYGPANTSALAPYPANVNITNIVPPTPPTPPDPWPPAIVTTASPHGYSTGMKVCIVGLSGGSLSGVVNQCKRVGAVTANTFEWGAGTTITGTYGSGGMAGSWALVSKKPATGCHNPNHAGWAICQSSPRLVNSSLNFVQVSGQNSSVIALTDTGELWGWGQPHAGQLGSAGNGAMRPSPIRIPTPVAIARMLRNGAGQGCVLGRNKKLYCWGSNENGTAGLGHTSTVPNPVVGANNMDFVDFSHGSGQATCGLSFTEGRDCESTSTTWGPGCAGNVPPIAHGTTQSIVNTTARYGTVDASCADGVVTYSNPFCMVTACRADGVASGGNPAICCNGDSDGNGTCGTQVACTADGASSGGNPANCCNGDSDGNGTCGTQVACSAAEKLLFASECAEGSSSNVTTSVIVTVQSCMSCGGGRYRAVCEYNYSHSEYGNWDEQRVSETNMYYNGSAVSLGSYCQTETRSTGHPSGAGVSETGSCPFVQESCP